MCDNDDYKELPSLSDMMRDKESNFIDSFFEKIDIVVDAAKKSIENEDILPF